MRVLCLDHGAARCGIAVSDPDGTIATPVGVVERPDTPAGLAEISAHAQELGAGQIVVGLPLLTSGEAGEQTQVVRSFAGRLRKLVNCEIEFFDERFTSQLAEQSSRAGAESAHDALAAAHILQRYLDTRASTGGSDD